MGRNTSFYYSFLVLPAPQREAIIAVWDFCRAVDDAVDEPEPMARAAPPEPGHAIEFWRREVARIYHDGRPASDQGKALEPFVRRFDLPRQPFDDVIDGVAMDLERSRYPTFDDLLGYCRRVASAVGLICIRIFGCTGERAGEYAVNLGIALQLTNILRDVKSDLARGRVYLPLCDLYAHGCTVEDLAAAKMTEPLRRLLAFECGRAREFYDRAAAALPPEDRGRLTCPEIMRAVYFETLRRIEQRGYDVFNGRMRVSRPRQALIALREWLWPRPSSTSP
jgi:phytoene synthase